MDKNLFTAGIVLIFVGIAIMILGPLLSIGLSASLRGPSASNTKIVGGGCVVIAFIPICFGYGMNWISVLLLAIVCAVLAVALYIIIKVLVRGVGFEPTQAYASGSLTRAGRS